MEAATEDIADIATETSTEVNVELHAIGVNRESGTSARRYNFVTTKDCKAVGVMPILAGQEVFAALSTKTDPYPTVVNGKPVKRSHKTPLAKLTAFCENAEITTPEGGVDLDKFVGQEFRLLCTVKDNRVFVNAALPPGTVETSGHAGM